MHASAHTRGTGRRSLLRCTCTLYCRAGVHARRGGLRRGDTVVLCKRRIARLGRIEATRKGIGKVMCGTPQSADADSSPCRGAFRAAASQSLPCKGRWMRRKAQTEGCIASWRRRYPAKFGRTLPRLRRGRCWHHPGTLRRRKAPNGGRKRLPTKPLQAGAGPQAAALCCARRRADASIGPYVEGASAIIRLPCLPSPVPAARLPCDVGRAFTPAGEGCEGGTLWFCVSAAPQGWGGLRQPGRVLARSCAAPLSRLTPTAPLAGEPFGWKPFAKPPLQGEVDAP